MDYTKLPKIELHLHLDCSLSYNVVKTLVPGTTRQKYNSEYKIEGNCADLTEYINSAESAIRLMQTSENLKLVVEDLFLQLEKDRVLYAEIRFAPLLHLREGLTAVQVVQAVADATEECVQSTGIEAGIILCTLRHFSEEQSVKTVELVHQFIDETRVCGFDMAGDEAGYPIDSHVKAFELAHDYQIPCTSHAGEACGTGSVTETLNRLKPHRIGHGVRSLEEKTLVKRLVDKDIHLEVCPTSNIKTNVFSDIRNHNIDKIYHHGISMSINTDGRTLSDVTLAEEYQKLEMHFNWQIEHFKRCNLEAIRHAFAPDEVKKSIRNRLIQAYDG
ncbi:adenosine deaminase [Rhodohalobacter mucosus]|uniref:adenosine deaminase n=1 Tax=Rhodohalobacter mucosus TaxID=2079485 RepID=A0A316TVW0_9BACT|nr:adenosine deaminase [Rhodohalobacter mucosus]PWN07499.1 adenosine deaminase [Rhodohalobacter mucosus]